MGSGRGMEINGIAHVQLTVRQFDACKRFYDVLLGLFEMTVVFDDERVKYWVGGRTAIAISRAGDELGDDRFNQRRVGLHHLCFRLRTREDVDQVHAVMQSIAATVVHPPEDGPWAPGYYSALFEDPDGIRIEVNHVPGKGNLDPDIQLPLRRPEVP